MSAIPWMGPHVARPLSAHRPCRSLEHPRGGPGWQGVHVFPQRCAKAPTGELQVPRSCACMLCVYDYMANFFLTCWVAVTTTNESALSSRSKLFLNHVLCCQQSWRSFSLQRQGGKAIDCCSHFSGWITDHDMRFGRPSRGWRRSGTSISAARARPRWTPTAGCTRSTSPG